MFTGDIFILDKTEQDRETENRLLGSWLKQLDREYVVHSYGRFDVDMDILSTFNAAGLNFAFPTQTIYVEK